MSDKSLGQVAYEAYIPVADRQIDWSELSPETQVRWDKVAESVASQTGKNIATGIKAAEKVNRKRSK